MTVPYRVAGDSFLADKPKEWTATVVRGLGGRSGFDLHPDGKRVAGIVNTDQADTTVDQVVFVFNFFDYLKSTVPAGKR